MEKIHPVEVAKETVGHLGHFVLDHVKTGAWGELAETVVHPEI